MQIYTITYKNQVGEIKEQRCTSLTIEDYKRHIIVTKGKIRCIELAHYTNHRLYSSTEYKVLFYMEKYQKKNTRITKNC